jgi:hypothetical protein
MGGNRYRRALASTVGVVLLASGQAAAAGTPDSLAGVGMLAPHFVNDSSAGFGVAVLLGFAVLTALAMRLVAEPYRQRASH